MTWITKGGIYVTERRKRRSFYDLHHDTLREWLDHQEDLGKSLEFILPEVIARYGMGDVLQVFLNQRVTDGSAQPLTHQHESDAFTPAPTVTTDVTDTITESMIASSPAPTVPTEHIEGDGVSHEPPTAPSPVTQDSTASASWQRSPDTAVTGDATGAIGSFLSTVDTPNQPTSAQKASKNALDLREEMIRNAIQD